MFLSDLGSERSTDGLTTSNTTVRLTRSLSSTSSAEILLKFYRADSREMAGTSSITVTNLIRAHTQQYMATQLGLGLGRFEISRCEPQWTSKNTVYS